MNNQNIHWMTHEQLLAAAVYAVEATSYEQHALWKEYHKELRWEGSGTGFLPTVGKLEALKSQEVADVTESLPVCVSIMFNVIAGSVVLFYHATSRVVDHDMVEAWIVANVPVIKQLGRREAMTDAGNFHNCARKLHKLQRDRAVAEVSPYLTKAGWAIVDGDDDVIATKVYEGGTASVKVTRPAKGIEYMLSGAFVTDESATVPLPEQPLFHLNVPALPENVSALTELFVSEYLTQCNKAVHRAVTVLSAEPA